MQAPRFIPKGITATAEQQAIQCARHPISLIEANAGAAKTTTLALRIAEALARGLAPQKILALVFTSEALEVLQQRLLGLGVAPFMVRQLALHTVEGFARHTLAFWEESRPPALNTLYEMKPIALEALERLSQHYAHHSDVIELEFRTDHVALSQFFESQLRLKASLRLRLDEEETAEEQALLLGVTHSDFLWAQYYEQIRQSPYEGVLFRGPFDGTYDLACTFLDNPELLQLLPDYTLIVVDELHDANEAAYQILRILLSRPNTYFVAAGDKDQVIYKQLAADASYLRERFTADFPEINTYPLSYTYRHGPYLAYAVAAFKSKKVDSALPLGTQIQLHQYAENSAAQTVQPVLQAIAVWQRQGGRLEQCAVLLRDEHQSIALENAFLKANTPYQLSGMKGYLHRDEILFLRGLMALALNDLSAVTSSEVRQQIVRALALFSEIALNEQFLEEASIEIADMPQLLMTFYQGQIQRTGSEQGRWRIEEALRYLQHISPKTPAHEVLSALCELMDMVSVAKRIYVQDHQADVIQKSIAAFIDIAKDVALNMTDFYQWCAQNEPSAQQTARQAVVFACVAQAKGKEYEHVLLPFLAHGEFPSTKNSGQIEQNLFYVGITRAQKRLSLFVPEADYKRSDYVQALRLDEVKAPAQKRLTQLQQLQYQQQAVETQSRSNRTDRLDLNVPFAEKDEVKSLGARWDPVKRVWYVPAGVEHQRFKRWL